MNEVAAAADAVATEVAMAFAVSWKPLMYSNTRAVRMTASTRISAVVMAQAFLRTTP